MSVVQVKIGPLPDAFQLLALFIGTWTYSVSNHFPLITYYYSILLIVKILILYKMAYIFSTA
jgi:hypothetical protein